MVSSSRCVLHLVIMYIHILLYTSMSHPLALAFDYHTLAFSHRLSRFCLFIQLYIKILHYTPVIFTLSVSPAWYFCVRHLCWHVHRSHTCVFCHVVQVCVIITVHVYLNVLRFGEFGCGVLCPNIDRVICAKGVCICMFSGEHLRVPDDA